MVITGNGITTDLLQVQGGGTKKVTGPMFINTVEEIDIQGAGPELQHIDGDLWHHRADVPGRPVTMPSNYTFVPANARGPLCTEKTWNQIVSQPVVPSLSALPPNVNGATFTMVGTCRVYAPGHFTGSIDLGTDDVYFQSGNYWFDGVGIVEVKQQVVWFGGPRHDDRGHRQPRLRRRPHRRPQHGRHRSGRVHGREPRSSSSATRARSSSSTRRSALPDERAGARGRFGLHRRARWPPPPASRSSR